MKPTSKKDSYCKKRFLSEKGKTPCTYIIQYCKWKKNIYIWKFLFKSSHWLVFVYSYGLYCCLTCPFLYFILFKNDLLLENAKVLNSSFSFSLGRLKSQCRYCSLPFLLRRKPCVNCPQLLFNFLECKNNYKNVPIYKSQTQCRPNSRGRLIVRTGRQSGNKHTSCFFFSYYVQPKVTIFAKASGFAKILYKTLRTCISSISNA